MDYVIKQYYDVNDDLAAVRRTVFIEEQDIPSTEEFTGDDSEYVHFCLYDGTGKPVGSARGKMTEGDVFLIGRVALLKELRGQGLGRMVMNAAEEYGRTLGCRQFLLHAQLTAAPFYQRLGYCAFGTVYEEAGIPHVSMRK